MPKLLPCLLLAVLSWEMSRASLYAQLVIDEVAVDGGAFEIAGELEIIAPALPPVADNVNVVDIGDEAKATKDVIIQRGKARWRYWDSAQAPAQRWIELGFDDSQWKEGQAPLGYGDSYVKTEISFGDDDQKKHPVAFFRHSFRLDEKTASVPAIAKIRMDDAVVVYVNAREVYRFNLPDGPLKERTMASVSLKPENRDWTFVINAKHLHAGDNVVAVSVHQRGDNSSDLLLDLELKSADESAAKIARVAQTNEKNDLAAGTTRQAKSNVLAARQSKGWKYWDREDRPQGEWTSLDYDDAQWSNGTAPLGYGDSHIKTKLSYGEDKSNKHPAAYFRRKFKIAEEDVVAAVVGKMLVDDGAVVYINGNEVFRQNLPDGPLGAKTRSKNSVSGQNEDHFWTFVIDNEQFLIGENILAVRVHQCNASSSDLSLDVELRSVDANAVKLARTVQNREARGEVQFVEAIAVADERRVTRQMYHLSDGETTYFDQAGTQHTMVQDAIQQARSYSANAKFARSLDGDTLEKLATMHGLNIEKLRLLNRHRVNKALVDREIFCLGWKCRVRDGDSLASLAKRYNSKATILAELNDFNTNAQLKPGEWIQVPGEFKYVAGQNRRQSYLQLGVYQNRVGVRDTPYDPRSQKTDISTLREGEDLAAVAKRKKVTEEFLRTMNGLADEELLQPGRRVLVKYSVRPKDDATLYDIAQFFGIDIDDLLDVNQLARAEDMKPGEPIEIPMGDRMNLNVQQTPGPDPGDAIFEVVLGGVAP